MAIAERIDLLVPEHALEELRRVLERKLGFSAERADQAATLIRSLAAECPPTPASVATASGDPDDDRILATALSAEAEMLVTGDRRHLLPIGRIGAMDILTPQALLALLAKAETG